MTNEAVENDVAPAMSSSGVTVRTATCRPPVLAPSVVDRRAALDRLGSAKPGNIVAVAAPAGYGKSILAAQWDLSDGRPFAWVSLDALDDDAAHLVAHIATALADRALLDTEDVRFLSSPGRSPLLELVPALLEILDHSRPFVLVLDDVHVIRDQQALAVIASIVEGVPANGVVALLSRATPAVGLARRRLTDQVIELGADDLAFTLDDAARVFSGMGVPIATDLLAEVVDRCEGWAGGIHLAALAGRDRDGDPAAITGRNRLVADYLVEEVLNGLDHDTARFLEEAAILEPMSAPLLDEVLDRTDAGRKLAEVEASGNLFLIALDDERDWYRFHHLFGELLTSRLGRRDPVRLTALHRRASDVLEAQGDLDGAIHHAVAAGDRRRAAALVQREAVALTFAGRRSTLTRRLALLDLDVWLSTPEGALAVAWNATTDADVALVRSAVGAALAADDGSALADGSCSVASAVALLAALIGEGGLDGIMRNTDIVIEAGGPEVNPWWGIATCIKATVLVHLGRAAEAREALLAAAPEVHRTPGFEAASYAVLALLQLRDGDLVGAATYTDMAQRLGDRHQLQAIVPLVVIYAADALVAARTSRGERAARSAEIAAASLRRLEHASPRTGIYCHLLLAEAHHALGDGAEARRHLGQALLIRRRDPVSDELGRMAAEVEQLLGTGLSGSRLAITPLTAAERRVLPLLATHLSLPQIAVELHVSRNTVKTHCVAVYRKLGVSSRAEAVAEARRLGLIEA